LTPRQIAQNVTAAMGYDKTEIAANYDKARALEPQTRRQWRDLLSEHINPAAISLIVDTGCGTGRFSELLAAHFGCRVIGVDPSQTMVDQARRRLMTSNVIYLQGRAEALPLADDSVDLVFMSMVYHHFANPSGVARECRRVLRRGGYACIRNGACDATFPLEPFFPSLRALIDSALPSRQDIESTFASAAFVPVVHRVVTQVTAPDWTTFAEKLALRADSLLARLSDDEFHVGIAALRAHGDKTDKKTAVTEEIDWFVFKVTGLA
jgi:ubiquinone/menaquinone biosynthesis C-methylase UbiE